MNEISCLSRKKLRRTIEVQFYNELAYDYGGLRKEFFRLVLIEIKEKYFDDGIRDLLASEYRTMGKILALSILQNGKIPKFLSPELVEEIFNTTTTCSSPIKELREKLNALGLYDLFVGLPSLRFNLQPSSNTITMKKVITMLKPEFSEEGSNSYQFEKEVYGLFIKYLREVAAERRGSQTLSSILMLVTSADEEPLLGFKINPSIVFCKVLSGFLPTASTCVNSLTSNETKLPIQSELFILYDYAFSNTFFGVK